jgi:hypothetical protein
MNMDDFYIKVQDAFLALLKQYHFSPPEFETLGRESYVRFHRNGETISISQEAGTAPLIELFLKCEGTSERPIPWAEREGIQRYIKWPKVGPINDFYADAPKSFEHAEIEWLANHNDD